MRIGWSSHKLPKPDPLSAHRWIETRLAAWVSEATIRNRLGQLSTRT